MCEAEEKQESPSGPSKLAHQFWFSYPPPGAGGGSSNSKTSQTDEEKQRDRQRNEREAKKEEQDAINYKLHKEAREARLLDFEIRRQQEREKKREEHKHQHHQQQQQGPSESSPPLAGPSGSCATITTAGIVESSFAATTATTTTTTNTTTSTTTTTTTTVEPCSSGLSFSGPPTIQTPPDRSCPPAFRSRSIERDILFERKRYSAPEAAELKEPVSTTPSPQTIAGTPAATHTVVAGPPATAAAATAAIIPILPLGVATLRDDSTESEQSVTCSQAQPDAYHRIM